ncbi:photosystem II reaction center W protein, chloroplastic [Mercurialis annua]|uniref:photosystem II reaction center W protein, chloroplastic n=1 Tax=Mercurialis annua TaxID=3986 RepID=UPI00216030B7|nr:photosystem II reaction center W protein, chloroplastic [Mercurialis annua]
MAAMSATKLSALLPSATFNKTPRIQATPILGLPAMASRGGRVRCSIEEKAEAKEKSVNASMVASMVAAVSASAGPAMALVDDRMSTEGTGLPFGLSNNLLGWILFGVFGLIWSLYTVYTSTLDEDDDSALSL